MYPHYLRHYPSYIFITLIWVHLFASEICTKPKPPRGGWIAVVVDERFSALRATPDLSGRLIRRVGRGRLVAVRAAKRNTDGIVFFHVNLNSRTNGWMQREAVVSRLRQGDDERLVKLVLSSNDFDRIARARIFLDHFSQSRFRPQILLLFGDTAEEMAGKLTRDATRRIDHGPHAGTAPEFSYYLNYSGLDRFNRQGVRFVFDPATKQLHYDGAAWRELIRMHPASPYAEKARQQLATLATKNQAK
jgi:hypothetical protein